MPVTSNNDPRFLRVYYKRQSQGNDKIKIIVRVMFFRQYIGSHDGCNRASVFSPRTMCGILAIHGLEKPIADRARFIGLSKRLRHRGPDWSGCYVGKDAILCHERLAVVGVGPYPVFILLIHEVISHVHRYGCPTPRER